MSTSVYNESIYLFFKYKEISIFIIIIFISKNIYSKIFYFIFYLIIVSLLYDILKKKYFKAIRKEKPVEIKEEINKVYILTKCNTLVNRDLLDKRNVYLDNVKKEYNDIYGEKGMKYFESIQKENPKPKRKKSVSFSGNIQYSN